MYAENTDFPLKGALVEVGIALGKNIPIRCVLPNVTLEGRNYRPLGSWVSLPTVRIYRSIEDALTLE